MPLKIARNRSGGYYISGLRNDFAAYERKIIKGQIPCPFTVEFRDSKIRWVINQVKVDRDPYYTAYTPVVVKQGVVVARQLIPLTPAGNPKVKLFRGLI